MSQTSLQGKIARWGALEYGPKDVGVLVARVEFGGCCIGGVWPIRRAACSVNMCEHCVPGNKALLPSRGD